MAAHVCTAGTAVHRCVVLGGEHHGRCNKLLHGCLGVRCLRTSLPLVNGHLSLQFGGEGRLGDGASTSQSTPARVLGGQSYAAISAGSLHTCAISLAGELYCWGQSPANGLNMTTTQPFSIGAGGKVVAVSAANRFTCALDSGGDIWCWGKLGCWRYWGDALSGNI